jgi:hypothetical protein
MKLPTLYGFGLAVCLGLSGCAGARQVRTTAGVLSLYSAQVKTEADRIASSRTHLVKARTMNLNALEESTVETESRNAVQLRIWQAAAGADSQRLLSLVSDTANLAASQTESLIQLQAQHQEALAHLSAATTFQTAKLEEASKTLATLAEKPAPKDEISFLVGFVSEVRANLKATTNAVSQAISAGTQDATNKTATIPKPK